MHLPSTIWTQILQIHQDPDRVKDLIVRRYQRPILEYVQKRGLQAVDAEDVTQEIFVRVTAPGFVEKADRTKGRFRSLLLAVTKHVIASFHRRELAGMRDRRKETPLDDFDPPAAPPQDDPEFDRLWVKNLVDWAFLRLEGDRGVQALRLQVEGRSYKEIATVLNAREHDVTNWIHRAKPKLKREIEKLIDEYTTTEDGPEEVKRLLEQIGDDLSR